MRVIHAPVSVTFKILDTMGYVEEATLKNNRPHVHLRSVAAVTVTI